MKKLKYVAQGIAAALFVVGFFVVSISAKHHQNQTPTNAIHVEFQDDDLHFVNETNIKQTLENDLDTAKGLRLKEVNLLQLEQEIEEIEYVANCDAFVDNNKQLSFNILQKKPLFRVIHSNGVSYYVDKHGIKFPVSATFTASVPIVTGNVIYAIDSLGNQSSKSMLQVIQLMNYLDENKTARALVTSVNVEPNGDLVFIPRTGKHNVNLGNANDLEDKFNRLFIFYREGLNKLGWETYSSINLKYKNQVIAKKKNT